MIQIESLSDEMPQIVGPALPRGAWIGSLSLSGCVSIVFFVILVGPGVAILRDFGIHPFQALPILLVLAAIIAAIALWRARIYSRKVDEQWQQRIESAAAPTRALARRYGYRPASEGTSRRHRVTISNIDAIWPFDDAALEDLGPGFVLRTSEGEHIYCAGDALLGTEDDGVEDGVFWLKETLILELGEDLKYVLSAACHGRRVHVADDEVPYDVLPAATLLGFAILDDPEIIRRLPPVTDKRPSPLKEGATDGTESAEDSSSQ